MSTPICNSLAQNPLGTFRLQEYTSYNWVAASSTNTNLTATLSSNADAAIFNSTFIPNSSKLQLTSTGQYVTADGSGDYALSATRTTASAWEQFIIRQKSGAPGGVYSILAVSNSLYVTISSEGWLINNGEVEADSAGFYFVKS